jgi:hypothetical protein
MKTTEHENKRCESCERLREERGLPDELVDGIRNAELTTGTGRLAVLRLLRDLLAWHEAQRT